MSEILKISDPPTRPTPSTAPLFAPLLAPRPLLTIERRRDTPQLAPPLPAWLVDIMYHPIGRPPEAPPHATSPRP